MGTIRRNRAVDARVLLPGACVLLLALALAAINPVGYVGGGGDDWQYLQAARCIAREGWCVPASHWAARLPIVLPTAAAIAVLGESRDALMIVPLAHGLAALALFVALMQRAFGAAPAALGGALLAATPIVGAELTTLNVGTVELFYALAAAAAFARALDGRGRAWAGAAGLLLALAVLSRATALALLPLLGLGALLLRLGDRRLLAPAFAGLLAVLALEAGLWAALIGDPLHGWSLSLGHTRLQSTETLYTAASPLFNAEIIAGWRRSMGIHVHWTADGALNLLADPQIAPVLWSALLLLWAARGTGSLRTPLLLLGAACLYFGALTYALGVDPKPRMFAPVAACAAAIAGVAGARVWRHGGSVLVLLLGGIVVLGGAAAAYNRIDLRLLERTAARWAGPDMAIDATAERTLTLVPAVRALPVHPGEAAQRVLGVSPEPCRPDVGWRLARAARFARVDAAPLAALRARGLLLGSVAPVFLCAFDRQTGRR